MSHETNPVAKANSRHHDTGVTASLVPEGQRLEFLSLHFGAHHLDGLHVMTPVEITKGMPCLHVRKLYGE
jgi:hypothetical protein